MIIKQLELVNFLSHAHSKIDFEKGVTVIYGHNGAGKSSIIDAIKFALFGEKRGSAISDLIRRGSEELAVTLDFTIGQHEYQIQRMMSLGKSGIKSRDAILTEDKSELARTVSGVDDTVSGILGIDKDTFMNSVFVEQGEIDSLISKTTAEKEKTFSKILGLDLLGDFARDLAQLSKDAESKLSAYSGLADDIDEIRSGIKAKEEKASELGRQLVSREQERNALTAKLSQAEKSRTEVQEKLARLNSVSDQLQSRRRDLDAIAVRVDRRMKDIREQRDSLEKLGKEVDHDLLSKADSIGEYFSLADSLPAKKELLKSLDERVKQIQTITSEIKNLEQGHNAYLLMDRKLTDLRNRREELESREADYRKTESRIREVDSDIEKRKQALKAREGILKGKLGLESITSASIQEEKKKIEGARLQFEEMIQGIKSEVGKANLDIKEISDNRGMLSNSSTCPLCLQPLSKEHMDRLNSEYREKEDKLRKRLLELAEQKKNLDVKKIQLEQRLEMLGSQDIETLSVDTKYIESLENEASELRKNIEALRASHGAYQTYMADVVDTEKKLRNLTFTYNRYEQYSQTIATTDADQLKKKQQETHTDIENSERRLSEMEKELNIVPDPNIRQKIRTMREKEKTRLQLYNELFALNSTQEGEKARVDSLKKEIEQLNSQLSGKQALDEEMAAASREYERVNADLLSSIREESSIKAFIETEKSQAEELKAKLAGLEQKKTSLDTLKNSIDVISKLRACFDREGIQKAIRKDSAVYITNKVREYSTSFNLDFDDVSINEEMGIEVSQNGNVQSIDMLSGGEKVALAIALRLALATYVMESIKTIVMDEPTTYLDEDRRSNLMDIIQYTFRGEETPVPQMILVTHHKELGSVADNVYEISKKTGESKVISV